MDIKPLMIPGMDKKVVDWLENNLQNYIKKCEGRKVPGPSYGDIEHIRDFLMSDDAPTRIAYMSYEEAKASTNRWQKKLIKKAQNIIEVDNDVEEFMSFKSAPLRWVKLVGKAAYEREGKLMSHCVSSYHGRSGSVIYSLRDQKNEPHCTVEVVSQNGRIQQIKGKGNGSIHPKYIKYVLKFLKKIKLDINENEMDRLGYHNLPTEAWDTLYKYFKPESIKSITFNGKRYFYNATPDAYLEKRDGVELPE